MNKTRKQHGIMAIAAIIVIALSMTACDNGSKDPAHTHDWEWVVTIPATIEADGLETETCKTCGAINGTRPIAQLPDNPNEVKDRTTTITVFGGSTNITVKGVFDKAGLDTAAGKIAKTLNDYYDKDVADYGETVTFDYYKENYATRGVIFIVEANPVGYTKYKLIGDGKTVYIASTTLEYVLSCIDMVLRNSTEVVKVTPTANKEGVNV